MTSTTNSSAFSDLASASTRRAPGVVLLEDFLKPRHISRALLARTTGLSLHEIYEIITGIQRITPNMALRLASALDTSALEWLPLHAHAYLEEEERQLGETLDKIKIHACFLQLHRHPKGQAFSCIPLPSEDDLEGLSPHPPTPDSGP